MIVKLIWKYLKKLKNKKSFNNLKSNNLNKKIFYSNKKLKHFDFFFKLFLISEYL